MSLVPIISMLAIMFACQFPAFTYTEDDFNFNWYKNRDKFVTIVKFPPRKNMLFDDATKSRFIFSALSLHDPPHAT